MPRQWTNSFFSRRHNADSQVASYDSGSVDVEVETKIPPMAMDRGKSKSCKLAQRANQLELLGSNGRNKKDKSKSKKKKSKRKRKKEKERAMTNAE